MKLSVPRHWIGELSIPDTKPEPVDGWIAIDTETTGLDPWGTFGIDRPQFPARPWSIQLCNADGEMATWTFRIDALTRKVDVGLHNVDPWLVKLLADSKIAKVKYNANYDLSILEHVGLKIAGEIHDVAHMCHALNPTDISYELKYQAKKYGDIDVEDRKELMDAVRKVRLAVVNARKRVNAGNPKPGDELLAKYRINEKEADEYTGEVKKDPKAARADMWLAPGPIRKRYGETDGLRTAVLFETCRAAMDDDMENGGSAWEIYRMEQKLRPVIKKMQDRGIRVCTETRDKLAKMYLSMMEEHAAACLPLVKVRADWHIGSTQSLQREFLVNQGLKPITWVINRETKKPTKCPHCKGDGCSVCHGTGDNPKVDNDFLEKYGVKRDEDDKLAPAHKLAWHVLHYKAASAMLGFVRSYKELAVISEDLDKAIEIIHPNYKQTGTASGRMSAERPNLQNVADDDSGKKKSTVPYLVRDVFIPRSGKLFLAPDYSQIEIWILYVLSQDKELGKILLSGGDTHGKVALSVVPGSFDLEQATKDKKLDPSQLTPGRLANLKSYVKTRKKAKNTQFCKVYGGGPAKIAVTAGCSLQEAQEFAERYESTFTGVTVYMNECIRQVRSRGYVENAYGRRYCLPRDRAYVGCNYTIQGSAADLIKRAMIRVDKTCETVLEERADLLLQIHDELLIECDREIATEKTMRLIADDMQADYKMLGCPVPFPVGMKVCDERWSKSREIKL